MKKEDIIKLLEEVASGKLSVDDGVDRISHLPYMDIGCANLDVHRPLRSGFSEVIYGEGKSFEQIEKIVEAFCSRSLNVFATRIDNEKGAKLEKKFADLRYNEQSRTFKIINQQQTIVGSRLAICCAGTADIPVAEEACETATFFGAKVEKYFDVGVAGLHRLISKIDLLKKADIIIVVAGMEGALPSVLGGMFSQPIISVPTSVGYGVQLKGLTALTSMLCSCAEGITVVNIDNGFGAACAAIRIFNSLSRKK